MNKCVNKNREIGADTQDQKKDTAVTGQLVFLLHCCLLGEPEQLQKVAIFWCQWQQMEAATGTGNQTIVKTNAATKYNAALKQFILQIWQMASWLILPPLPPLHLRGPELFGHVNGININSKELAMRFIFSPSCLRGIFTIPIRTPRQLKMPPV